MSLFQPSFSSTFKSSGAGKSATGKRGSPRQRQTGLLCNLGQVVDLSATGARVRTRGPLSGQVDLVLTEYTRAGELRGQVIWAKAVGNFHYEVGVRFHKVSRDLAGRLNAIAMEHRFRRVG